MASLRSTHVVLTGFGSFSGVALNPTQQIIEILRKEEEDDCWIIQSTAHRTVELTTEILEVSTVAASEFLDKIAIKFADKINSLSSSTTTSFSDDDILIFIHLGVDGNATNFKLESNCYNNMTFRVPDERGFQPSGILIEPTSKAFDEACRTTIPLGEVDMALKAAGYPVVISTDPGRYLCNYIYFKSLQFTSNLNHTQHQRQLRGGVLGLTNTESPRKNKHHSLFIHVPPVTVVPLEKQCLFIKSAIQSIVNCTSVVN